MVNIAERLEKIKPFYWLIVFVLMAIIFFGLGRLSALEEEKTPIRIENGIQTQEQTSAVVESSSVADATADTTTDGGQVIGISTSKKYYFPWCGAVKTSNPANQVTFTSTDAARAAGYLPGGNCKGLK